MEQRAQIDALQMGRSALEAQPGVQRSSMRACVMPTPRLTLLEQREGAGEEQEVREGGSEEEEEVEVVRGLPFSLHGFAQCGHKRSRCEDALLLFWSPTPAL